MRAIRPFLIALGALTVTLACESPTGVPQAPVLTPGPQLLVIPLVGCSALPPQSVTRVIQPRGGSISFGPHKLVVPASALAKAVSITAELAAGAQGYNEVRLYPDGLKFHRPAHITISYANCDVSTVPQSVLSNLKVVYIRNGQIVEYVPTVTNLVARTVTGSITHFSNYAIAW